MRESPAKYCDESERCAQLAARLLVEGSAQTFDHARRKAASRLNLTGARQLPDNRRLFSALIEYQRLFDFPAVAKRTEKMRRAALIAMRFFEHFSPRITGAAMHGTPYGHSPITLHLFTDESDAIARFLIEERRPYRSSEVCFRVSKRDSERFSCYETSNDLFDYKLIAMPHRRLQQPPLSPVDGKPIRRLDYSGLEALVAEDPGGLYGCHAESLDPPRAGRE
ncbi:MAG: hypothetical protein EXR86_07890 [Gammaproteobacteria bacterium]|nr:hypothetical protein [Gammaproteobacteria bacterium]